MSYSSTNKKGGINTKKILTSLLIISFTILLTTPALASASTNDWTVQVSDLSGNTVTVSYNTILSMPQTSVSAELDCYGRMIAIGEWTGVRVSDLFSQLGIAPTGLSVDFFALDGYKVNIAMDTAMRPDVIIAYNLNGSPLVSDTLRLVLPQANGDSWISMITAMNISANPHIVQPPIEGGGAGVKRDSLPKSSDQPTPTPIPNTTPTLPPDQTSVEQPGPTATQPPSDVQTPVQGFDFPATGVYAVGVAVAVAAVIAGFIVIRRARQTKISN